MNRRNLLKWAALAACVPSVHAQERFSLFVGSDLENVRRMVELAALRDGDMVLDLGSGDGRIVLAAARANPNVRGVGVDIDAELVKKSTEAARQGGLGERVRFVHQNAFDADLREADVIFMWLFPELMRLLRPKILNEAKAGARVIAASWDFGSWPADGSDDRPGNPMTIRKWIVPAKVEGAWEWDMTLQGRTHRFLAVYEQRMQAVEGLVRAGNRREVMRNLLLRGSTLHQSLRMTLPWVGYADMTFVGVVKGDSIDGTIVTQVPRQNDENGGMDTFNLSWRAKRVAPEAWYAPTGLVR